MAASRRLRRRSSAMCSLRSQVRGNRQCCIPPYESRGRCSLTRRWSCLFFDDSLETSNDRIGGATPPIPPSDDNKDAVIRALALSPKKRKGGRIPTFLLGVDGSGRAG